MTGEKDLDRLLPRLSPVLLPGEFVFCCFPDMGYGERRDLDPVASIEEHEGLTLVIPKAKADEGELVYDAAFRRITLNVHSSLDAVGLTAAFSGALAEQGISANVVAGYFHDHIFVPSDRAEEALTAIVGLAQ